MAPATLTARMAGLRKFLSLPLWRKALLAEAAVALCVAWVVIRLVPFRSWSGWVGERTASEFLSQTPSTDPRLGQVKWAIDAVANRAPGFTCLMIALAGLRLLRRRQIRSVIVFGVDLTTAGETRKTLAHAWLTSGPHVLFGQKEKDRYTAVFYVASR